MFIIFINRNYVVFLVSSIKDLPEKHPKEWGYEEWITNTSLYCGKKLVLNRGYQCSIHHHKIKDETFYINSGIVLMILDGEENLMKPKATVRLKPGVKHRFIGLTSAEIFEFSTQHKEDDSYREEGELSGKVDETLFEAYLKKYEKEIE